MAYFQVNKKPILTFPTLTGSIVTFNSQYVGLPLKSHVVNVDYTGSAISGVNVTACGVNLWNSEYTPNTWISETSTGAIAPHVGTGVTDYIPIVGGTSYYKFDSGSSRASYFDMNKNCLGGGIASGAGVITTPANACYVRFTITDEKIASFGLNYPSSDTDYHSFNGQSFYITFPTPIYGGTYDAITGIVTSDKDSGGGDVSPTYQQTATANCLTLLGENNIFADTGDTTLQYPKFG